MVATLKKPRMNEGESGKHGFPAAFWFVFGRSKRTPDRCYKTRTKRKQKFRFMADHLKTRTVNNSLPLPI
jgi:hypothetical protein